ncbi:MAG: molecular chaperone DnaJ [Proteobacteria bacterium]|nr:molecular chaperone DnaJ [Pseudomonadota bacterium]
MTGVAAEQELYHACRIIFGPDLTVSREFLEYIQFSGVKSAFRKKAMETHPDRLAGHDELAKKRSARMFHSVQQAYEKLLQYLEAREKGFRFHGRGASSPGTFSPIRRSPAPAKPQRGKGPVAKSKFSETSGMWERKGRPGRFYQEGQSKKPFYTQDLYRGTIPDRQLLFGHYLYYAGQVSWQSVIKALMWQKTQRPRLGEIARSRGLLSSDEIFLVLKGCVSSTLPFGQQALQQGLLTKSQLISLLFEQRRQHKKIGEFFVQQNILTSQQLQLLLVRFQRHNTRLTRSRPAWTR